MEFDSSLGGLIGAMKLSCNLGGETTLMIISFGGGTAKELRGCFSALMNWKREKKLVGRLYYSTFGKY